MSPEKIEHVFSACYVLKTDGKILTEILGRNFLVKTLQTWEIHRTHAESTDSWGILKIERPKWKIWYMPNLQIARGNGKSALFTGLQLFQAFLSLVSFAYTLEEDIIRSFLWLKTFLSSAHTGRIFFNEKQSCSTTALWHTPLPLVSWCDRGYLGIAERT